MVHFYFIISKVLLNSMSQVDEVLWKNKTSLVYILDSNLILTLVIYGDAICSPTRCVALRESQFNGNYLNSY